MKWHRKKNSTLYCDALPDGIMNNIDPPNQVVIIGAGTFVHEIINLIKMFPEYELAGILDPSPKLKYQALNGSRILGWLGDIPANATSAIIGIPSSPNAFDREAVFHILQKRNIQLPILQAPDSNCASDVLLHKGTILLQGSSIHNGSVLGLSCLIGPHAKVHSGSELENHAVVMPHQKVAADGRITKNKIQPKSLKATLAFESDSIQTIIKKINWASMEIMLITDANGTLTGTVTDGDIRRGILAGIDLNEPVSTITNRNPITVPLGTSHIEMLELMHKHSIRHLPVLDNDKRPVRLEIFDSLFDNIKDHDVIVMAGGLGTRLHPLTKDTPKPLLNIAGRPILDHILDGLKDSGLQDIVISVNYLGDRIKEHVGNGQEHDLNVAYLSEHDRMGTAGALSLIRPRPKKPFLVMNGDLMTNMNFSRLINFQKTHNFSIVMCVCTQKIDIPYGVVEIQNGEIISLKEKPSYKYFFNAGIYVIDPSCIDLIPNNRYFDMTDLINTVMTTGGSVGAFPVIEYWKDIGTPKDLNDADIEHINLKVKTA